MPSPSPWPLAVLSARGDQTETDLDFGLVDQLLRASGDASRPMVAAGEGASATSSFAVGARLLEVVGEQQATRPVAIVIDDLQWADRRSVEALTFMLRRLSVDPVAAVVIYRGPGDQLNEAAQRLLGSIENRLFIALGGLDLDEVAALAAVLTPGSLDEETVQRLYRGTGGHPLYLRTVLSEGSGFDPRAPGRIALPRSLAAAVGEHLRVLPPDTRTILQMLAVLNLRTPLAQLGQAAQVDSPSAAIEPAVISGLVDWWPEDPTSPVAIRHPLVRDAIYAGITAAQRRTLHARAAAVVSESASWEHRVAALDRPDESLADELERLAGEEAARGRLALAATHLQWASDISPVRADRERRLLTAALHLMLADEARGMALRTAVEDSAPSPLRSGVLGTIAFSTGQLGEAEQRFSEALAQARAEDDPASRQLAAMMANRLAGTYTLLGDGEKVQTLGRWALETGGLDAAAASQTRTLIAIGACQVAGPRPALAELAHLDADPARIDPVEVDGLAFRGVFRLLAGDLDQAVDDMTASLKMARNGATLTLGLRAYFYLALAQYLAGAWVDDVLLTAEQGFSAAARSIPARAATSCRCCIWRPGACRPAGASPRRPSCMPGWPRRQRAPWTTDRNGCTRRWPGPWSVRPPATTWALPTRWATGVTRRSWTAAAGRTRRCGGRCWSRASSALARPMRAAALLAQRCVASMQRPGLQLTFSGSGCWLDGWLAEELGSPDRAREIYQARRGPGRRAAARSIPPACSWPTDGCCGARASAAWPSSDCGGPTICISACARRRSSPGSRRSWRRVICPATRRRSMPACLR